ncbi:ankyrin repeat-containing domain protein, partial [Tuber indicum]
GIDVNTSITNSGTPLHAAIMSEDIEIISMLLKHPKINVNPITSSFWELSLLIQIIWRGNIDILKLLLADTRVNISTTNSDMETPLIYAISRNDVGVVQLLLQYSRLGVNASVQNPSWNSL